MIRFTVCQRLNVHLFKKLVDVKKKSKSQENYELSLKAMWPAKAWKEIVVLTVYIS